MGVKKQQTSFLCGNHNTEIKMWRQDWQYEPQVMTFKKN